MLDGDRMFDTALEQLEAQSTDTRTGIQQRPRNRTGADEQVAKQSCRGLRPFASILV